MHHLVLKALAGPALFFASNAGLAQEKMPSPTASSTSNPTAEFRQDHKPRFIVSPFDAGHLKEKAAAGSVVKLRSIPMPDGTEIDVDLRAWTPFGPDCALQFSRVGIHGKSVERVLEMQDVTFLKGHVRGRKDSVVMIAAKDDRMEGFFSYEGSTARITRDTSEPTPKDVILPGIRPKGVLPPEGSGCGMSFEEPAPDGDLSMAGGGLAGASGDCHLIRIAFELDYELYSNSLNADGLATLIYVAKILYTADEVVRRDLGAQVEIASVNVWTEPDDPWTSGHYSSQLEQFIDYCNDPANQMLDIPRDATMLLSGRSIGGGQAGGIGALSCDRPDRAYMVCGHMSGDFPYPAVMNHDDNWDIQHFIHEFGHLLNGMHTHSLDPPVDTCGIGCSEPERGSVMSYCHHCPGGDRNRGLWFHMRNQDRTRDYLDSIGCLEGRQASIAAYDDAVAAYGNSGTRIDVLLNDGVVCSEAHIHSHDAFSTQGGIVRTMLSAGPMGRDVLQYLPPRDFLGTDSFTYQAADQHGNVSMAQVVVEVEPAPFITDPEYLVIDMIENSISRLDAHSHTFKGHFVPELEEVVKNPSSILPLPDGSVLVGDRSLQKILEFDVNGEYRGVFFEHPDLFHPEAMAHADGEVFIMDALGGWVFKVHLDGGVGYSVFQGVGTGQDAALGSDGTFWITGDVNGNAVIGIDPRTGIVRHEIYLLETITQPGAISTAYGDLVVADAVSGAVATFDALGDGAMLNLLLSRYDAMSAWFGGGLEMSRAEDPNFSFLRYGMITTAGVFELDEFGSLVEIGQHGSSLFSRASAIGYRSVPDRSPDINGDGCVNGSDLTLVLSYFGGPAGTYPAADLDLDGRINGADLTILLGAWSDCP